MGRKQILPYFQVITDGDMSGDITSSVSTVEQVDQITYDISWTGSTPVGEIFVQYSNNNESWNNLDFGTTIDISGNSGSHKIDVQLITSKYMRLFYDFTSGTGTIQAHIKGSTKGA